MAEAVGVAGGGEGEIGDLGLAGRGVAGEDGEGGGVRWVERGGFGWGLLLALDP